MGREGPHLTQSWRRIWPSNHRLPDNRPRAYIMRVAKPLHPGRARRGVIMKWFEGQKNPQFAPMPQSCGCGGGIFTFYGKIPSQEGKMKVDPARVNTGPIAVTSGKQTDFGLCHPRAGKRRRKRKETWPSWGAFAPTFTERKVEGGAVSRLSPPPRLTVRQAPH